MSCSVVLLRADNEERPTPPTYRPADAKAKAQLTQAFRWRQYWEGNRLHLPLRGDPGTRARLSPECEVEVEYVSPTIRETRLYVNGVMTSRSRRNVASRAPAIDGASVDADGGWFVMVRDEWEQDLSSASR